MGTIPLFRLVIRLGLVGIRLGFSWKLSCCTCTCMAYRTIAKDEHIIIAGNSRNDDSKKTIVRTVLFD